MVNQMNHLLQMLSNHYQTEGQTRRSHDSGLQIDVVKPYERQTNHSDSNSGIHSNSGSITSLMLQQEFSDIIPHFSKLLSKHYINEEDVKDVISVALRSYKVKLKQDPNLDLITFLINYFKQIFNTIFSEKDFEFISKKPEDDDYDGFGSGKIGSGLVGTSTTLPTVFINIRTNNNIYISNIKSITKQFNYSKIYGEKSFFKYSELNNNSLYNNYNIINNNSYIPTSYKVNNSNFSNLENKVNIIIDSHSQDNFNLKNVILNGTNGEGSYSTSINLGNLNNNTNFNNFSPINKGVSKPILIKKTINNNVKNVYIPENHKEFTVDDYRIEANTNFLNYKNKNIISHPIEDEDITSKQKYLISNSITENNIVNYNEKKIIETSKINIYTYKNNINSSIPEKQKLTSTLILTNDNDITFVFLSPVSELLDIIIITNIPNYYGFFVASIVPFFYLTQLMIILSLSSLIIKLLHQSYISFSILIDNLCKKAFEYKYYKMISFISKKLDFIILFIFLF